VSTTEISAPRARIIAAAADLFGRYGVGSTSLQMIADEIGVTKAAVYHQYNTKEEIILAVAEDELAHLQAVIAAASRETTRARQRDALVLGIVDLAVDGRRTASSILSDPAVVGSFADDAVFRDVMHGLRHILIGDSKGAEARVETAMLIAAISGAVMHPFVVDLDDDQLRRLLLRLARRFLGLPEAHGVRAARS
jgi:AcrR family transcriptional regulator